MQLSNDENDALLHSFQLQAAASGEGFDWPDISGVLDKVAEELGEIRDALAAGDSDHARRELGDLLLVTVNLSRFLGANPRQELVRATERFGNRFEFLKKSLALEGKNIQNCAQDELESRWQHVKHDADKLLSSRA